MYALFEDSGKLHSGRILSETQASSQIELDTGKRLKVKDAALLLKFESPEPASLLAQSNKLAAEIDLQIAWEFAPNDEFSFQDLSIEYFSATPSLIEQVATLLSLQSAPHYFRRAGKGRFKKASAEVIAQALVAIERKKEAAAQLDAWANELVNGVCPQPVLQDIYKILFKPDKNSAAYKCVVEAAKRAQTPAMELLKKAGAIASAYEFHWQRFLFDQFPKGTDFSPQLPQPEAAQLQSLSAGLPLSAAKAYSIDDSQTTEIDDALSVQGLGSDVVTVGIHIAAPALWIKTASEVDKVARARLSTVYMPGVKITMLPKSIIEHFTLAEGRACPALSLYVSFDSNTLSIQSSKTVIERVHIERNLRHDQLDRIVTAKWLGVGFEEAFGAGDSNKGAESHQSDESVEAVLKDAQSQDNEEVIASLPKDELSFLYRLALQLKAAREVVRGKPENFNRPDFNFHIEQAPNEVQSSAKLKGDERVRIEPRHRGAPLDLIVAEAMILANSTWGKWMADLGVPGIYRSQASMAPGIKVRMGTKALPHAGIGVGCYAWSTSPLRRYTDLVNQWQICACAEHGATAALVAPFKPKDTDLLVIISSFDSTYSAYNAYQSSMERYWTLKYLEQNNIQELSVSIFKTYPGTPPLARADTIPLVLSINGAPELQRGALVRVRLSGIDLMTLDINADFIELSQTANSAALLTDVQAELEEEFEEAPPVQSVLTLELDVDAEKEGEDVPSSEQNAETVASDAEP
jgi:exoribonuclease-2